MSNSSGPPLPPAALGVVCSPEQWNESNSSHAMQGWHNSTAQPTLHCLTRGQSLGLTLTTEAAFVSLVAVLYVIALIARDAVRRQRDHKARLSLLRSPADIYMLSLLVADLVQAVGTIMDIRWIHKGIVRVGGFCTAQGIIQQLGETPVAATTLAIAVHTFLTVRYQKGTHSRGIAALVVAAIWIYPVIFIIIGTQQDDHYETPTPYWCWIGPRWLVLRIMGEYIWLWLALVASFVLYFMLALWWRSAVPQENMDGPKARSKENRLAYDMLAYPLTYAILVLPLTIVRWMTFGTSIGVPSAATFFIITLYGFSGAANVLLLLITRPQLLLFNDTPRSHHPVDTPAPILPDDSQSECSASLRSLNQREHDTWPLPPPSPSSSLHATPRASSREITRTTYEDPYEGSPSPSEHVNLRVLSPGGRPSLDVDLGVRSLPARPSQDSRRKGYHQHSSSNGF